ncbi:MAG: hypothetical protein SPE24_08700 [Erysipelotrichaceae bacterium]|nr:hypothetical protein [Erysipelotrichaceae bacterium]
MFTGYTAFIEDGTITTGKEFLLLCSSAFGIALDIRDEPLTVPTPTHFEPDNYYQRRYDEAVKKLAEGRKITFGEAREHMRKTHADKVERAKLAIIRMKSINDKYAEVRGQIVRWNPPTEEHKRIKNFALEQIDMCINPESMFEYYQKIIDEPFIDSNEAVQKYMEEFIGYLEQDVARAKEALEREIENAKGKTVFMKEFIDSLDNI